MEPNQDSQPAKITAHTAVAEAVLDAFGKQLDLGNVIIRECLDATAACADIDHETKQILISKAALIRGILTAGDRHMRERPSSPAAWLTEWIFSHRGALSSEILNTREISEGFSRGYAIVISEAVRAVVLPRARRLAKRTTYDGRISSKHLVLAVVDAPSDWIGLVDTPFEAGELADLKDHLVRRILEDLGTNDNLDGWDELARAARGGAGAAHREAKPRESVPTLADHPATVDALGRSSFARILARRLRDALAQARERNERGAFMVHLHGPWGQGKTTVLNFLRVELERSPEPWLVVDFNAWKHHRLTTPWWHLIKAVYARAIEASAGRSAWRLRFVWWTWRLRADWMPILLVALTLGFVAAGLVELLGSGEIAIKILTGTLTAAAGVYAYMRFLFFGSAKAAETYAEIKVDPYQPVVGLYARLIRTVDRPVAIFIDDLDRCESEYVVELIEGVQTVLRSEAVSYVVAADRKWICSAFEKKYSDFAGTIGDPARPLGYLFLDKLFQISAALPSLSRDLQSKFWRELLEGPPPNPMASITPAVAEAKVKHRLNVDDLRKVIAEAPAADRPALRAAAAMQITTAESAESLEHRLQPLADLLEPNPRAMKRLVNAVGMAQARMFLEARDVPLEIVARWTLLELRWPLLAEYLASHPGAIEHVGKDKAALDTAGLPPRVIEMVSDPALPGVVTSDGIGVLDGKALGLLLR
jgi:hypothetical protein